MILVQLVCDGCRKVFAAARPGGTLDHARLRRAAKDNAGWGKRCYAGPWRDYCPECLAEIPELVAELHAKS